MAVIVNNNLEQIERQARFPLTLIWPKTSNAVCVSGQWRWLEDGRIEATYNSRDELTQAVVLAHSDARPGDGAAI